MDEVSLIKKKIELRAFKEGKLYFIELINTKEDELLTEFKCTTHYGAHKMWISLQLDYFSKVIEENLDL